VSITLHGRHGHVTPLRRGCTHTGGGNIDVAQPSPDVLVITMTGAAVAIAAPTGGSVASMDYDLDQCFEVTFDKPDIKAATLSLEGRVIGLLRSHASHLCKKSGLAEESGACATVGCGPIQMVTVCAPAHSVAGGDNLSINDHDGPCSVPVMPGKYTLHQVWHIMAQHPCTVVPCKADSAEFAPDPALDPLWISYWEPFHGAIKKDFGFQVTVKVAPQEPQANGDKKAESLPPPERSRK
jgi:hypothetical protein